MHDAEARLRPGADRAIPVRCRRQLPGRGAGGSVGQRSGGRRPDSGPSDAVGRAERGRSGRLGQLGTRGLFMVFEGSYGRCPALQG